MNISQELYSASQIAVRDCMGVKPGERILVVTDEPLRTIGYAL
ncbi:MAG: aminopeptidase, partial [Ignavibacteriales bacterium]|nr:aminopeptidase [Ignavibacteriales bacterium]